MIDPAKTLASAPQKADFAASGRKSDDRNSDLGAGEQQDLLPHNGLDRNGLFRAPIRFRGSNSDGAWDGCGVPPQTRGDRQATSGDRRGSDPAQSRLDLGILPNFQAKPKITLRFWEMIIIVIAAEVLAGGLILWAVTR